MSNQSEKNCPFCIEDLGLLGLGSTGSDIVGVGVGFGWWWIEHGGLV